MVSFYFLRTGYYSLSDGYINARVTIGHWWSDAVRTNSQAHNLTTYTEYVIPEYTDPRGYGFAVRCVVREEWEKQML